MRSSLNTVTVEPSRSVTVSVTFPSKNGPLAPASRSEPLRLQVAGVLAPCRLTPVSASSVPDDPPGRAGSVGWTVTKGTPCTRRTETPGVGRLPSARRGRHANEVSSDQLVPLTVVRALEQLLGRQERARNRCRHAARTVIARCGAPARRATMQPDEPQRAAGSGCYNAADRWAAPTRRRPSRQERSPTCCQQVA